MIYNITKLASFLRAQSKKLKRKLDIGIVGGSFNPAHYGHLNITLDTIKSYKFDYVIWLVANQNPNKPKYTKDIYFRAEQSYQITKHYDKILISTAENDLNTYQTSESLKLLSKYIDYGNITWIMGSDNLEHFHNWKNYEQIIENYRIIIFEREGYNIKNPFLEKVNSNIIYNDDKHEIDFSYKKNNIILHKLNSYNISSSSIRNKITNM